METSRTGNISHFKSLLSACLVLCLLQFLPSCKKSFYNNRKLSDKLVVFGEITAGDSVKISIGKSLIVGNGTPITFEKINNASVFLSPDNGASRQLLINNSTFFTGNPTSIYSHSKSVDFKASYSLEVKHPLLGIVTSRTMIPGPFNVDNVNTEEDDVNGEDAFIFSFSLNDPGSEKNYYVFEAVKELLKVSKYFLWQGVRYDYNTQEGEELYERVKDEPDVALVTDTITTNKYIRLNLFTQDQKTDNDEFGSLDSSFRRIFIMDSTFNGQPYYGQFAVSMKYFQANTPEETGRVLIQVKSVTKELYDYLSHYEKYKSEFGNIPTGQLTSPPGNIVNGLGVFGGVSKKEWKFYFDDLE